MCFHGGSYRVLPGINEHATFILKRILETLFFHRDNFPDREFVRMATRLIHGTLALSERICAAAEITRNPLIETRFQEAIVVPDGTVLTRLRGAVRFSRVGFGLFLEHLHLPPDCLQPLMATEQDLQPDADFQISGLLSRKPIIATGTDVVVASRPNCCQHSAMRSSHSLRTETWRTNLQTVSAAQLGRPYGNT
jgi:hypothetical protein